MADILQEIIRHKRKEVAEQKRLVTEAMLQAQLAAAPLRPTRSMKASLMSSQTGIIAEFKRRSPSKGWIFPEAKVEAVIPAYQQGGASACSVLTDASFFGGSLDDLIMARRCTDLPLLRKEFIIDPYQLAEARLAGADAILLIASCLTPHETLSLARAARELQLEVLLEIHTREELGHLNDCIDLVGVNNRHLGTFETSTDRSFDLLPAIKAADPALPILSESGITGPETVVTLRKEGYNGFLIGETFMRGGKPGETLSQFIAAIRHDR
ncbi:MAG: indole-3-glycerol phosphate synthase TrpC [Marinilabiliales bacterium]|nr:indole-3-glycerol phosphate synthase TrpC [Marinilabiliales bacterium]